MKIKKWTKLIILIMLFFSIGSTDIAKAEKITNFNEKNAINLERNQINATTSSAATVTKSLEGKVEQNYKIDLAESAIETVTHTYVNPMYEDLDLPSVKFNEFSNIPVFSGTDTQKFSAIDEASTYMRQEMVKRTSTISMTLTKSYYETMYQDIFNKAILDSDLCSSSEGDYLYAHFSGYRCSISYTSSYVSITYQMSYLSTYDQEQEVNTKVKKVLNGLNIYNSDEYTKIKAVHDYIVKNIKYDKSLQNHSAYDAIIENNVVCQGFASLTYKMLKELGLRVRYITGMGNGGRHAWNIIYINNKWYNVDNTWDENISYLPTISYKYFLKSNADFGDHIRFSEYDNDSFNKNYPMASVSYVYVQVRVISLALNSTTLSVVKGNTSTLTATIAPSNASNKAVTWKSSNTAVATVDSTGKVTGIAAGTATITCTASDGSGKSVTCVVTVTNPLAVTGITLNSKTLSIVKGNTGNLAATVAPSNATNKAVTWKSGNTAVATVDSNGKITGVAAGSAIITCTANDGSGKSVTCVVTVTNPITVTGITLNNKTLSIVKGNTGNLTATVAPSNVTNKSVTWKSSNTAVATVDSNGKITGVAAGSATITCTSSDGSGKSATCVVTVTSPITVTGITLNKTLSVVKGNTSTLTATVAPSTATNKNVTWKSSNTSVATVDSTGKVTGGAAGTATITCSASDGSGKASICTVTVTSPIIVTGITLNKTLSVVKGNTGKLTATVAPSIATNKNVTWKSSNIAVATVDSTGRVTGVAAGSATITCTASDGSGKFATCAVVVTNPVSVTSVALNKTSLSVIKGQIGTLIVGITPITATNPAVKWKSSNSAVATVDSTGRVTGVAAGSATITCTASDGSGKYAICTVTVTNPVSVTSVTLNKTSLSVIKGQIGTLIATVAPSAATNKYVTWKSSNTSVAIVDSTGKVTGVAAGTATITCTANDGSGKSATCAVTTTNPITATGITLNSKTLSIVKGSTGNLTATVAPSNVTNKGVTWKSSNTAVATIDSNGKIIGVSAGSATITCTASDGSGKSATCTVMVTNPVKVTGITLNSKTLSVVKGNTGNLSATVAPSNASNKAVTWKSSNTVVATVDSNGKIIGVSAGSSTITCTASDGSGKTATCVVTVIK